MAVIHLTQHRNNFHWFLSFQSHKLAFHSSCSPNIGMSVCLPLLLHLLLLPLDPGSSLGILPVLPHPGHPVQETSRVPLGRHHTQMSPHTSQDDTYLLFRSLATPCQAFGLHTAVCYGTSYLGLQGVYCTPQLTTHSSSLLPSSVLHRFHS